MKKSQQFKTNFLRVWRDPVWSKVIAAFIIFVISIIYAKITHHSWAEIYAFILKALSFNLPVYVYLAAIAFYFIVGKCIELFQKRSDPFWDEKMGNYTFKDLYNIFVTETFPIGTVGMEISRMKPPEQNFLFLFQLYYVLLIKGVDFETRIDDGNYLYSVLAPRLVGFGLVDVYDKTDENLPDVTNVAYKISEMGKRFHAKLDKIKLDIKLKEIKQEEKSKK